MPPPIPDLCGVLIGTHEEPGGYYWMYPCQQPAGRCLIHGKEET